MNTELRKGWKIDRRNTGADELSALTLIDAHEGREALVLGNGPSLAAHTREEIDRFTGRRNAITIGVNRMWECWGPGTPDIPCQYIVILDSTFFRRNSAQIDRYWDEHHPTFLLTQQWPPNRYTHLGFSINIGLRPERRPTYRKGLFYHGACGGVAATQMAIHMGVNRIFMLGHDCIPAPDGASHSFGLRAPKDVGYSQGKRHLEGYEYLPVWAEARNCELVNLSEMSAIKSIPKMTMENARDLPLRDPNPGSCPTPSATA